MEPAEAPPKECSKTINLNVELDPPPDSDVNVSFRRDYAGAVAKSNPAEIRLVRKLDMRIMVCHPPSCRDSDFADCLPSKSEAHSVVDVLFQLRRPGRTVTGSFE